MQHLTNKRRGRISGRILEFDGVQKKSCSREKLLSGLFDVGSVVVIVKMFVQPLERSERLDETAFVHNPKSKMLSKLHFS